MLHKHIHRHVKKYHRHYLGGFGVLGLVLMTMSLIASITNIFAAQTGPNSPTTVLNNTTTGSIAWAAGNLSKAVSSDNQYANTNSMNSGQVSNYLIATGFNFSIPTDATIDGISVNVEKNGTETGTLFDNAVRIVKDGVIRVTDRSDNGVARSFTDATTTYGSSSDKWGETRTPAEINSGKFGFAISARRGAAAAGKQARIDRINITIYYTTGDTTPPTLAQVTAVPTPTNDTTPDYTFSSSETGTITYSGDCSSTATGAISGNNTITFNALSGGTHSNCVIKVTDAANNSGSLNVSSFMIDTTAPVVTLNGSGTVYINLGNNYTEVGATWSDNIDGAGSISTPTNGSVNTGTAGTYILQYKKIDTAGNSGSATRTVIVRDTAPIITPIIITPTLVGSGTTILVVENISGDMDTVSAKVFLNTSGFTTGFDLSLVSGTALNGVWSGLYTFDASIPAPNGTYDVDGIAVNSDGITGYNTIGSIMVDRYPPSFSTISIDLTYVGTIGVTTISVSAYDDVLGVSGVTIKDLTTNIPATLTSGTAFPTASGVVGRWIFSQFVTGAEGYHTEQFTVQDVVGNAATITTGAFIYDITLPVITLNGSGTVYVERGTTYTELGATRTDNIDGTGGITNPTSGSVSANTIGTYILFYSHTDNAGNIGTGQRTVYVQDTIPPTATVSYSTTGQTNQDVTAAISGSELITVTNNVGNSYIFTGNGSFTFQFVDVGGNTGSATAIVNNIDKLIPTAWVEYYPGSGAFTSGNVLAIVTGFNKAVTGLNATGYLFTGNGSTGFTFQDFAGNTGSVSATVTWIDKIAPTLTQVTPVPTPTNNATPQYTFSSNEAGTISYSGNCSSASGSAISGNNTITFNTLSDGAHNNCMIRVTDATGNPSNRLSITAFTIDTIAPTASGMMYTITGATNQDVTATITGFSKTITGLNAASHLFTESGSFEFTFSDLAGNTGSATATVTWIDKFAPVVTVSGSVNMSVFQSGSYIEKGATWTDNVDGVGVLMGPIAGSVNTYVLGTYILTYSYTDTATNSGSAQRTVHVISGSIPIININGANPYYIEFGLGYTEDGATRIDAIDGTDDVTDIVSTVDTNAVSTGYTVTYTKVNSLGNTGTAVRDVIVQDTTPPVVTLNGLSTEYVERGSEYSEQGATRTDDPYAPGVVSTISGLVDDGVLGTYYLEYIYADPSGNTGSETRTVIVQDTVAPTVLLSTTNSDPTSTGVIHMTAQFSESVTGFTADDITLGNGSVTDFVAVDGDTYTFIVNATTEGVETVDIDSSVCQDLAGRDNEAASQFTITYTIPLIITTYNVTGTLTITGGSVTIDDATPGGDTTFTTTGILIIMNGLNILELDLDGLTITSSGGWDKILFAPQEETGIAEFGETGMIAQTETGTNTTTTRVIVETVKVGGNVGLSANAGHYFRITFIVPSAYNNKTLKLFTSQDGDTWTANTPDATCSVNSSSECTFRTSHMSYFAAVSETTTTTSTSNGGGGASITKDICPQGDLSPSFYDGICDAHESAAEVLPAAERLQAYDFGYNLGFTKSSTFSKYYRESFLTRYEMAKMVSIYATQTLNRKPDTSRTCTFKDIGITRRYYTRLACQLGLMGIGDTSGTTMINFEPNLLVTRAHFGTVLSRLLYGSTYDRGVPYYLNHLNALKENNIITNTDPELKEVKGFVELMLMRATNK